MQTRSRQTGDAPSVAEVMRRQFITASPDESLPDVRQTMRLGRLRHLLIAQGDLLLGLVSYRDLLEALLEGGDEDGRSVSTTMTAGPDFVTPATPVAEAAERLCRYGFGCLPVVEEGEPGPRIVGLVTETDLLRVAFKKKKKTKKLGR